MPGSSFWSSFGSVARTWMLRLAVSILGLIAMIFPTNTRFGKASTFTLTAWPVDSFATDCCGSRKSTKIGSSAWSVAITVPADRNWPRSIWRRPSFPVKGARRYFLSTMAFCVSTCALALRRLASSLSTIAWLMAWAFSCLTSRS